MADHYQDYDSLGDHTTDGSAQQIYTGGAGDQGLESVIRLPSAAHGDDVTSGQEELANGEAVRSQVHAEIPEGTTAKEAGVGHTPNQQDHAAAHEQEKHETDSQEKGAQISTKHPPAKNASRLHTVPHKSPSSSTLKSPSSSAVSSVRSTQRTSFGTVSPLGVTARLHRAKEDGGPESAAAKLTASRNATSTSRIPAKTSSIPKTSPSTVRRDQRKPPSSVGKPDRESTKSGERSGYSSPGSPGTPTGRSSSQTPTNREPKKIAIIRTPPKSPASAKSRLQPVTSPAAMPDLKNVRSKIGSTDNIRHQPGGGRVQIVHRRSM
uniref:Microtubule-associated protein n=1 Tax=Xenopus laevis TaxID=8355 RepID=B1WBA9_XENLA|nr:LOC100158413 protein [Xenopus laevis]